MVIAPFIGGIAILIVGLALIVFAHYFVNLFNGAANAASLPRKPYSITNTRLAGAGGMVLGIVLMIASFRPSR